MDNALHEVLAGWGNFYLLTGTAAAALTGLQFVVQTLLAANLHRSMTTDDDAESGIAAFGTPTVVHFTLALVVSALLCVPWPTPAGLRTALDVLGTGALGYSLAVLRRARRQRTYVPVAEDWLWHVVLPSAAYAAILAAGVAFGDGATAALFALAAASLLLLCIGIHNAWDTVAYLTVSSVRSGVSDRAMPARPVPPRQTKRGRARGRP